MKEVNLQKNSPEKIIQEYNPLIVNLKYSIQQGREKVFAICSGLSKEGKTTNILNMGITLANEGSKVLLVDADFWHYTLSKNFDADRKFGLSTYLSFQTDYESIIKKTEFKNLYFVPCGRRPVNPPKYFQSNKMNEFFSRSRKGFDFILVDTPAILFVPEIQYLLKNTDGIIMIIKILTSTKDSIKETLKKIKLVDVEVVGTIVNDVRNTLTDSYYSSYYNKYYYKKDKYYNHRNTSDTPTLVEKKSLTQKVNTKFKQWFAFLKGDYGISEDTTD